MVKNSKNVFYIGINVCFITFFFLESLGKGMFYFF